MNFAAHKKFVIGIEDRPEHHYQSAIFAESLAKHLSPGDEIFVVVCNDGRPLSNELETLFDVYQDNVRCLFGRAFSNIPCDALSGSCNPAMNKIEALNVVGDHCQDTDMVILTDADVFLYREFNPRCIPTKNTLAANEICAERPFYYPEHSQVGVDLDLLLRSLGCDTRMKPGGVSIFLDGRTVKNRKFRNDCLRFCQLVYVAAHIVIVEIRAWMSEMVGYALALTYNQIDYDVMDIIEFSTVNVTDRAIKKGSFYHYYVDVRDNGYRQGAFVGSLWQKHDYRFSSLLDDNLEYFLAKSVTDHEKYFFEIAIAARDKLHQGAI